MAGIGHRQVEELVHAGLAKLDSWRDGERERECKEKTK